jgi:cytoskeleton protein RodZ
MIWLMAGLVIVVAFTLVLFVWLNRGNSIMPQAKVDILELPAVMLTPASLVITVPPSTESNNASRQSGFIRLTFDADSWVKVTDNDGKILLSQLNSSGSEQHLKGKPPFSVIIGNISGVHLYYQGRLVELAPFYNGEIARLTLE